ncbi:MAG: PD-(D/E)XK nuclease family protein [Alistipes sp.]|nr:PD-(D/E)XK nuclease family protein [Alistipes sp.]
MRGFLNQVAADLYTRYGDGVSSLHVVFPSRRASLFFGEALAGLITRPLWQPASVTIDEVAGELSELVVGERLRLVVELFKIYAEFHPAESFDGFWFWGELLLGDFEAIDKYMVDADVLFSNLVDLHALDDRFDYLEPGQREAIERFWGVFSHAGGGSREQQDFLKVWRTLAPVYHRFRARLRELGIAYQGMMYREAAERILAGNAPQIPDRHYVIAGFNALSRSEQVMFDHLRKSARVDFYWDHDDYFTGSEAQEAGMFMRDNLRRFPSAATLPGGHANFVEPKRIRSIAAASDVLQCKAAGMTLADIARRTGHPPGKETAVVLCNESLLVPLLWSMPQEVASINVTMGYPLRMHPAYTFVERLVELQSRRRGGAFYHSDVEGLVRHSYLAGEASAATPPPRFVYIGAARLRTSPIFEKIFAAPEGWRALSDYLIDVLSEIGLQSRPQAAPEGVGTATAEAETACEEPESADLGQRSALIALIVEHIRRLAGSIDATNIEPSTKTYAALLRRSLQSVTIPFEGEPLEGVQVMGILETRALDFDNIIFLSTDDAHMPGSLVGAPSFIPYNLKAAYGLPTPEHHEGVWSYHFFRLISRARNVDMLWSRTADEGTPGTPSRYILQLDYESPHDVEHRSIAVDVNLSPPEPVVVEKDVDRIPTRLSPSLFYSYVECPLKFYFRAVARLRTEDEVTEGVDDPLLGNLLHRAMQLLYTPLVGVRDPRKQIGELVGSAQVAEAVSTAVKELCAQDEGAQSADWGGAIALAHKTVTYYIDRAILPFDAAQPTPFTIEKLEERIETTVKSGDEPAPRTVIFSGIADRIDRLADGTRRVIDYKTGNPANNASALLQMGLYALMLGGEPQTHLYYIREMTRPGYTPPPVAHGAEFEEDLHATLSELFDPSVPFTQTPDPKPCAWCDFAPICRRL